MGKNSTDSSESLQDVPDTAVGAKPVESAVNSTVVRSKMSNGILNGSVSGIKCNMGTGVIASHASVEDLLTNRKEYLRASTDSGISQGDTSSSEESESGSGTRSTAECAALLKTPVRICTNMINNVHFQYVILISYHLLIFILNLIYRMEQKN